MPKTRKITLSSTSRLRDSERQPTSMLLPVAVHHRLDELVRLAVDVKASRAEVVAMLIANSPNDAAVLEQQILKYRKLTVGEVIGKTDTEEVVVPIHGPGRRRRDDTS